jgi:long-chain acyl-CoA synthetase
MTSSIPSALPGAPARPARAAASRLVTLTASYDRAEVARLALRTAGYLRGRGVRAGDRVLLKADNSVELVVTFLALLHLDTSVALVDSQVTAAECARAGGLTRARWLLGQQDEPVPGVTVIPLATATRLGPEPDEDAEPDLSAWARRGDALITWSSGSTGAPKAVVRRGQALLDNLTATAERMRYRDGDVLLPLLPFTHFYGLTLLMLWWRLGLGLAVTPAGRLDRALRLAAAAGATVVDATPSTYWSILRVVDRHPQLRGGLRQVRMWCVGGAPLSETLADDFAAAVGLPLLDGYGSSEAGNIALAEPSAPIGCGRPLPGVQVRVVDPDGTPVDAGAIGRILVRTPALMAGYLAEDGGLSGAAEPYYPTGDLGYLDAAGYLFVIGRANAVHRFGHTLYPSAIEQRAQACGVPVKVLAFDDARRGSQLVFVLADPGGGDPREWQERLNALLPGYERPNHVLVMAEFPVTSTGKPDLAGLRQYAQAQLADPAPAPARGAEHDVPFADRVAAIEATLDLLRNRPEPVLELLTEVATRRSVQAELAAAIATLEGAVAEVARTRPATVERMAVFMPSNVLLYGYVLYVLVPSLYVRTITFRPSSKVAAQTARLHDLLAAAHQLPVEVSTLSQRKFVEGPGAAAGLLAFTGTYANAERVRASLRREQVFVYFGQGLNPFVLGPDADIDLAVADAIRIRLHNCGQDCFGPDVFLVPQELRDEFVAALVKRLSALRPGDYADPGADYGGLFYPDALAEAVDYLVREHATIAYGGQVDFRRRLVEPTVFVRDGWNEGAVREFFAPLFNIVSYADRAELRRILTSAYVNERAMGAMAYGLDAELIDLLGRRHAVAVNRTLLDLDDGNQPFGGRGMMANYVSFNGNRTAEPLLLSKAVADCFGRRP